MHVLSIALPCKRCGYVHAHVCHHCNGWTSTSLYEYVLVVECSGYRCPSSFAGSLSACSYLCFSPGLCPCPGLWLLCILLCIYTLCKHYHIHPHYIFLRACIRLRQVQSIPMQSIQTEFCITQATLCGAPGTWAVRIDHYLFFHPKKGPTKEPCIFRKRVKCTSGSQYGQTRPVSVDDE